MRHRCRHHHSPTSATEPAGQDPEARPAPVTVTVPLCSRTNASPFWIMLLRFLGRLEHGMTPGSFPALKATLFALLDDEQRIGAKPTNSFAMWLGASV